MPKKSASLKEPRPPFVQASFYFSELSTRKALLALVEHLIDRDARFAGSATLGEVGDADDIADLTAASVERISVGKLSDLLSMTKRTGRAIATVTFAGVGQGSANRNVIVRVLPIPGAAVGADHHPISMSCDGRAFEPDARPAQRKRAASDMLALFRSFAAALQPSYGAILFEYPLPCPYEVAERPDGFEFQDCYLSSGYLGGSLRKVAPDLRAGGQWIDLPDGALILASGVFAEKPDVDGLPAMAAMSIVRGSA